MTREQLLIAQMSDTQLAHTKRIIDRAAAERGVKVSKAAPRKAGRSGEHKAPKKA